MGDDGSVTVHASVEDGGTTVNLPEPIELIHFGKVYRDDWHQFRDENRRHEDRRRPLAAAGRLPVDIPAHGLMYRAALMRETILLGGFIRAQMDALIAEEKSKGVVGLLAQIFADMTGSAGATADKPSPVDLDPAAASESRPARRSTSQGRLPDAPRGGHRAPHGAQGLPRVPRRQLDERQAPALKAKTPTPGGGVIDGAAP